MSKVAVISIPASDVKPALNFGNVSNLQVTVKDIATSAWEGGQYKVTLTDKDDKEHHLGTNGYIAGIKHLAKSNPTKAAEFGELKEGNWDLYTGGEASLTRKGFTVKLNEITTTTNYLYTAETIAAVSLIDLKGKCESHDPTTEDLKDEASMRAYLATVPA